MKRTDPFAICYQVVVDVVAKQVFSGSVWQPWLTQPHAATVVAQTQDNGVVLPRTRLRNSVLSEDCDQFLPAQFIVSPLHLATLFYILPTF
jgi:hypothetical protein